MSAAVAAAAAADRAAVEKQQYTSALQTLTDWLEEKYGEPDALVLQQFLDMVREPQKAAHSTAATWGACILGKFQPLQAKNLATLSQANCVFLNGLDTGLRTDMRPFLLAHPPSTCALEDLVNHAEAMEQARASLSVATGKGKSPAPTPGMTDTAERKQLRQLAAKHGVSLVPAGSSAPQPNPGADSQPRPRMYCEFHRSSTHNTADCTDAKRAWQQEHHRSNTHNTADCKDAEPARQQEQLAANAGFGPQNPPHIQMQHLHHGQQPHSPMPAQPTDPYAAHATSPLVHMHAAPAPHNVAPQHLQPQGLSHGPEQMVRFASPSPWAANHTSSHGCSTTATQLAASPAWGKAGRGAGAHEAATPTHATHAPICSARSTPRARASGARTCLAWGSTRHTHPTGCKPPSTRDQLSCMSS